MATYSVDEKELYRKVTGKKKIPFEGKTIDLPREMLYLLRKVIQYSPEVPPTLEERVESLEREVLELKERSRKEYSKPTKADLVYEIHKKELEKEHFGKIVAIDIDSGTVVGIGDSIREAYKDARKKSEKTKFSYKRVGYPFICRLR